MKKINRLLLTLLPSVLMVGLSSCGKVNSQDEDPGEDTAIYSNDGSHAVLGNPDISNKIKADDDDDEEEVIVVNKVILHYFNEDGGNKGRAFYLWVTGQDGKEYNFDNSSDIMSCNTDGTMMTITIDFTDPRFTAFAGKSKLFFIVKYKMISSTNLNWGGQSDDMQLVYSEFPPKANETVEVWTMPAAGGGIAILSSEEETQVHGIQLAKFTDWKTISCELTKDTTRVDWKLYAYDETYYKIRPKKRGEAQRWYLVKEGSGSGKFNINLKYDAHVNMVYSLVSHDPSTDVNPKMKALSKTVTVGFDKLYESAKFNTYYEDKNPTNQAKVNALGMTYTPTATTFRVWSPVSANVTCMIYDSDTSTEFGGDDLYEGYHMHYTTGGIWELTIDGDLKGKFYNYQVDNTLGTNVCMDPYATSAGTNGVRGFIYDKADSNPTGWDALPLKWDGRTDLGLDITTPQQLSIYEVHVQDFTGDDSWASSKSPATKRGTYEAFVESGTEVAATDIPVGYTESKSTGYDHLNELGVNAVQLVPVFDSDNDESDVFDEDGNPTKQVKYNWGYNPLNYNVVEGAYSSNPRDGLARVKEFKNLVLKMSQTDSHTRVIMDVVYNHVSSATGSCFHKLMPRYYFRYAQKDWYDEGATQPYQKAGELWDGSGCHNEVASERPMMSKFIVDSLKMWATEYKIKGFRFDLMGLIDFQTLIKAKQALYEIDPDIYMYGEGWSLGYHGPGSFQWNSEHGSSPYNFGAENWQIYNELNNFKTTGVYLGGFNNAFRDAIRGDNGSSYDGKNYPNSGWAQKGNWRESNGHWYVDYGALDSIAKGMWGTNTNVNTNGDLTGYYPEQTINYASCHDNWTVRDQLYQTLTSGAPASAEALLNASLQVHSMVFASNSAAFMLGGEELFRTKELTEAETKESYVTADSWTKLHGHYISHNSYNAPLRVNTFKWGNKIKFAVDSNEIDNQTYKYFVKFQDMIKLHNDSSKKRGENNGANAFYSTTSAGAGVMNIYWSEDGNFSNCTAFQVNETFIYTCSGGINSEVDYIQCDSSAVDSWTRKFIYGSVSQADNKFHFGVTNSIAIYKRG
ncbi:MAG: hypothetical protein K6E11_03640 [Bacilli bacterium]|nr:hypothetical protein [Bacilli bacterium]